MSRKLRTDDLMTMLDFLVEHDDSEIWKSLHAHMKDKYDQEANYKLMIQQMQMEIRSRFHGVDPVAESPVKYFESKCEVETCGYIWCTTDWESCPKCRGIKV